MGNHLYIEIHDSFLFSKPSVYDVNLSLIKKNPQNKSHLASIIHQFKNPKAQKLNFFPFEISGSSQNKKSFPWISRLEMAAKLAKALAHMHKALEQDAIPHGNLKSSNILINRNMEPCISEYGLMEIHSHDSSNNSFKSDVYGFGLILLELLTGKLGRDEKGVCLADWVRIVLREEWTAEVLDTSLMAEAASEERMVNLLVVAVKCVESSPNARPNMDQVVAMIDSIKEDEEESSIISV